MTSQAGSAAQVTGVSERKPRALLLAPLPLDHPPNGTSIRLRSIAAGLRSVAEVVPLCFRGESGDGDGVALPPPPSQWERLFSPTPSLMRCFCSPEYAGRVQQMAREADFCLCSGLQMTQYTNCLPDGMPVILDNINVESDILERLAAQRTGAKRLYWRLQAAKLRRVERRALRRADRVIAISDADRGRFETLVRGARVTTVRPGLRLDPYFGFGQDGAVPGSLVFIGALGWHVNVDAAQWMVREVLPRVRTRVPDATVDLVGRAPAPSVVALGTTPGVSVHADVPDVLPWLQRAAVVVVPLRYGSGVQTKVIEAMAAGRPVVTTGVAAEGLDVVAGEHLLIAGDAEAFACACVDLLLSPPRSAALGQRAREAAREYTEGRLADDVAGLLRDLGCIHA